MLTNDGRCPGCGERYEDCKHPEAEAVLPYCDLCSMELVERSRRHVISDNDVLAMLARHLAFIARRAAKGHRSVPFWCQARDGRGRCRRRAAHKREGHWVCHRHIHPVYRLRTYFGPSSSVRYGWKPWHQRTVYARVCGNPSCGREYETTERRSKFCSHRCSAVVSNKGRRRSEESLQKTALAVRMYYEQRKEKVH